jgi:hypothetical protein
LITSEPDVSKVQTYVKFSLVYLIHGQLDKALPLLEELSSFLRKHTDPRYKRLRDAENALAELYGQQAFEIQGRFSSEVTTPRSSMSSDGGLEYCVTGLH